MTHFGPIFCVILLGLFLELAQAGSKTDATPEIIAHDFSNHPCRRKCRAYEKPRVCEYEMVLLRYSTMSPACFNCPNNLTDCARPGCILGSGTQKSVLVANLALPGPSIEVCLGDRIRVTVQNLLQTGEMVSIHWHGLHQRKTPYMDGVEMVTQCPIVPGTKFTYDFETDSAGTFFWHSNVGLQRGDGLAGPLIVRHPKDPHRRLYDRDDLSPVMAQDWLPSETWPDRYSTLTFGNANLQASHILLNGRWPTKRIEEVVGKLNLTTFPLPVPAYTYHLNPKKRYRFRLINNAIGDTPIKFEFTSHNMVVIASDGEPIRPIVATSITLMGGERYDVVPYFTGEKTSRRGVYYIAASALGPSRKLASAKAFARLAYEGGASPFPSTARQASLNATNDVLLEVNYWNFAEYPKNDPKTAKKVSQLRSISHEPEIKGEPDVKIFAELNVRQRVSGDGKLLLKHGQLSAAIGQLAVDLGKLSLNGSLAANLSLSANLSLLIGNLSIGASDVSLGINNLSLPNLTLPILRAAKGFKMSPQFLLANTLPQINSISNTIPLAPLLAQWDQVPKYLLCNSKHRLLCKPDQPCECMHLEQIQLGALVEIILVDSGASEPVLRQPFHLHGYHLRVVAMDKVRPNLTIADVLTMDRNGLIQRNLKYAPLKDVVSAPVGGYAIIRFRADHPGVWLFHSNIDLYKIAGMSMLLRVGEQTDLPPMPVGFPQCSGWEAPRYRLKERKHKKYSSRYRVRSPEKDDSSSPAKKEDSLLHILNLINKL